MIGSMRRRLGLEIHRNEYRWLFLVVAIGVALALTDRVSRDLVFWTDVTLAWRDSLYILAPWTAAAAAWTAGRERRHQIDDLLATTPASAFQRRAWAWLSVTLLGIAAFLAIGVWVLAIGGSRATLSHLDGGVIVVALAAIPAFAAIGFTWGAWKPKRGTPVAAMIGLALLQPILSNGKGWVSFLSPTPSVQRIPWHGISPDLSGPQFWFFAGITALCLTLLARLSNRGWAIRGSLAASTLVIVLAVAAMAGRDDQINDEVSAAAGDTGSEAYAPASGSYTLLCSGDAIAVCVHPAFEPVLAEVSRQVNALAAAIGPIPGSPSRVLLLPALPATLNAGEWSHLLTSAHPNDDLRRAVTDLARTLIAPVPSATDPAAQNAVLAWALTAAGRPISCQGDEAIDSGAAFAPVDCDAVARLTAMDPAARTTWLAAHLDAIRAGTITTEELP